MEDAARAKIGILFLDLPTSHGDQREIWVQSFINRGYALSIPHERSLFKTQQLTQSQLAFDELSNDCEKIFVIIENDKRGTSHRFIELNRRKISGILLTDTSLRPLITGLKLPIWSPSKDSNPYETVSEATAFIEKYSFITEEEIIDTKFDSIVAGLSLDESSLENYLDSLDRNDLHDSFVPPNPRLGKLDSKRMGSLASIIGGIVYAMAGAIFGLDLPLAPWLGILAVVAGLAYFIWNSARTIEHGDDDGARL